jgi:hypothetical protein
MQASFITLKKIVHLSTLSVVVLLLNACGSYPLTTFEDSNTNYNTQNTTQSQEVAKVQPPSDSYYKQYFNSKTEVYDALEQGNVFTDIDAYNTTGSINKDGYIVEQQTKEEDEYGAWGENSKDITINIYDHTPIVRWNRPYWWYGSGWGYSYNWCSPFWGIGYGWGYPYYGYYGWGYPYYYGGYYNNFYNHYYGNPYNGYAFSRGRRNSDYYNGTSSIRSDRYAMRDASRGVSIARTKNIRRNSNNITASSSTRVARRARTARNNPQKRYSRNLTNYSSRSNTNTRKNNNQNANQRNTSNYNRQSNNRNNSRSNTNSAPPRRSSTISRPTTRSSGSSRKKG